MMVETRRAARKWLALPAATLTLVALAAPIRAQEAGKDTDWAMVWWFRDGKVIKFQIHDDSATEAAALRGT